MTTMSCTASLRSALFCPRLVSPLRRGLFAAGDTGAAEGMAERHGRKATPSQPTLAIVGQGRDRVVCPPVIAVVVNACSYSVHRLMALGVKYLNCECFKTSLRVAISRPCLDTDGDSFPSIVTLRNLTKLEGYCTFVAVHWGERRE